MEEVLSLSVCMFKVPIALIESDDESDARAFSDHRLVCVRALVRRVNRWMNFAMRALGPCLVLLGVSIVCVVSYVHFKSVLPLLSSFWRNVNLVLSVYLLMRIACHYFLVVFTKPGSPTLQDLTEEEIADIQTSGFEGWCSKVSPLPFFSRTLLKKSVSVIFQSLRDVTIVAIATSVSWFSIIIVHGSQIVLGKKKSFFFFFFFFFFLKNFLKINRK